jgi:hypothetical protein
MPFGNRLKVRLLCAALNLRISSVEHQLRRRHQRAVLPEQALPEQVPHQL